MRDIADVLIDLEHEGLQRSTCAACDALAAGDHPGARTEGMNLAQEVDPDAQPVAITCERGSTASDGQTQQCKADGGPETSATGDENAAGIHPDACAEGVHLLKEVAPDAQPVAMPCATSLTTGSLEDLCREFIGVHHYNAWEQYPSRTGEDASRLHQQVPSYLVSLYASVHLAYIDCIFHNAQEEYPSRTGENASRLHQHMPSCTT